MREVRAGSDDGLRGRGRERKRERERERERAAPRYEEFMGKELSSSSLPTPYLGGEERERWRVS